MAWKIYVGRPLTDMPRKIRRKFDRIFEELKTALRKRGYELLEFTGLRRNASCRQVTHHDLTQVENADLVLGVHPCPSSGLGGEIAWKCALKGHVIAAAPRGLYVSRFIRGFKARNPNFRFMIYDNIMELVGVVARHFQKRGRRLVMAA
jgi:hypothetical protein